MGLRDLGIVARFGGGEGEVWDSRVCVPKVVQNSSLKKELSLNPLGRTPAYYLETLSKAFLASSEEHHTHQCIRLVIPPITGKLRCHGVVIVVLIIATEILA